LDDAVGRVLDTVDDVGLRERTLVAFLSDNGAFMLPGRGLEVQSNAPLRGGSVTACEGGVRVPALFRWPGQLPAGAVNRVMLSSLDMLPLAVAVAGGTLPDDRAFDGCDPLPALRGTATPPHRALHWIWKQGRKEQWSGMREGDYKLLRSRDSGPWQLFDLSRDAGEHTDLAASRPEKLEELVQHFEQWKAGIAADSSRSTSLRQRQAGP
jgi:arylsulfatase A-like enzyme